MTKLKAKFFKLQPLSAMTEVVFTFTETSCNTEALCRSLDPTFDHL